MILPQGKKVTIYKSRNYLITITELDNGHAYCEIYNTRLYKHGIYRWMKKHAKLNPALFRWFEPTICLVDYARDYGEYYDCLDSLRHSKCARRWFVKHLKPYTDKYF